MSTTRKIPLAILKKILSKIGVVGFRYRDPVRMIKEELIVHGVKNVSNTNVKKDVYVYYRRNRHKNKLNYYWSKIKAANNKLN